MFASVWKLTQWFQSGPTNKPRKTRAKDQITTQNKLCPKHPRTLCTKIQPEARWEDLKNEWGCICFQGFAVKDAVRRVSRCTGFFDNVMIPINSSSIMKKLSQWKHQLQTSHGFMSKNLYFCYSHPWTLGCCYSQPWLKPCAIDNFHQTRALYILGCLGIVQV